MKYLLILLPCFAFGQSRPIEYSAADSIYLVPKERAQILEAKARSFEELLPVVDSLVFYGETQTAKSQRLATELFLLEQELLLEAQTTSAALADCRKQQAKKREPNIFERLGYTVSIGMVRFLLNVFAKLSK